MKKINYVLLVLFLIVGNQLINAQCLVKAYGDSTNVCGGAVQLHVDPLFNASGTDPVSGVNALFFVNSDTGFAAGNGICKTMDGGQTWNVKVAASENYRTVFFTSPKIGYTASTSGKIIKTTDAGDNWTLLTTLPVTDVYNIYFVTDSIGFLAASKGSIYKTVDAGKTWTQKTMSPAKEIRGIHFPDVNTGYAVDEAGNVFKTSNGGNTWSVVKQFGNYLQGVFFTTSNVGYAGGSYGMYKTTDGGLTWTGSPDINSIVLRIQFTDINTGYASTRFKLYKTTDGGTTWRSQNFDYMRMEALHFPNANIGYVGGGHEIVNRKQVLKLTIPSAISWTPAATLNTPTTADPIASPIQTTTYKVTTITKGCYAYDSIKITVLPLEVSAGDDKTITCGNNAQLGVTSNYTGAGTLTYSWSPTTGLNAANIANPVATLEHTTKYYVTVTTPNGCTSKDSVTIFVGALTADAVNKDKGISCGSTVQLDQVQTNYTGPGTLAYSWLPATGLNSATVANPKAEPIVTTTYTVTVKIDGCTATDSVLVNVYPLTIDAMSNKTITCGGSAQLDKVITSYVGGGALTYSWLPTTGLSAANIPDPIASPTHTTKYYIKVTSPTGCSVTDSVTVFVNLLTADAGLDKAIICGDSAKLDPVVTNYTGTETLSYSWLPAHDLNSTTIANPLSGTPFSTTYKVTVTSPEGCKAVDSVMVLISPLTANAGSNKTLFCKSTVQLDAVITNYTGTASLFYSWQPAAGFTNPNVANPAAIAPGTYTVTVTTLNGCVAKDVVKADRIAMNPIDICMVSVDSAKNLVIWNKPVSTAIDSFYVFRETNITGNYAKIGSVAYAVKSVFKDLSSQPEIKSTKYKISILDVCGLESEKSTAHKTMHLSINKGTGITWNLIWENYEGIPVATYKIYRGTNPANLVYFDATSGSNNQYTDNNPPLGDVYYQLEVINPTPCANQPNSIRSNVARNNQVGIQEISNTLAFSIYPNPATDVLTVNVERKSNATTSLTIYNALGASVKTIRFEQNQQQISISDLDNGFYTIKIQSANYGGQQKLIIQK
jgi:photosystem II stability/assembly factor-like uncharacterized protein